MAITTIYEPQDITPAYNPMKFLYDSTNKNNLGFKYIFDVYQSGTSNKIAEYRVYPQRWPKDGHEGYILSNRCRGRCG